MKTILFTNARDEHHILEWVIHHLHLGFDSIYIIDHLSIIYSNEILISFLQGVNCLIETPAMSSIFRLAIKGFLS